MQAVRSSAWRLIWVGPMTVIASAIAVAIVQLIPLRMSEWPLGSPVSSHEPAIFTAVLVSGAVVVFLGVLLEAAIPARAFARIERQLKDMTGKPQWQVAYVISTNLAIIRMNVANTPRTSSN